MSERKVLNKYYPPDFDPSKIPRLRLAKSRQYTVRLMSPCNMRCNTCGDYIAKGKKFNARKETVESETYLGLKVFRFYFKCPKCMQEITFRTDPKNMDYEVEKGATPNFKALKLAETQAIQEEKDREEEERLNPMKLLENRTKASRIEMETIEALEDLKEINQRQLQTGLTLDQTLSHSLDNSSAQMAKQLAHKELLLKQEEEEDQLFVESIFQKRNALSDDSDEESLPKFGITFSGNKNTNNDNKESKHKPISKRKLLQNSIIIKKKKE